MKTQMLLVSVAFVAGCAQPEVHQVQRGNIALNSCKDDRSAILKSSSGLETADFVNATLLLVANSTCPLEEIVQNLDQRLWLHCDSHCYTEEKK